MTAGDPLRVQNHQRHGDPETERGDRQAEAGKSQGRHAEQKPDRRRDEAGQRQRHPEGQIQAQHRQGRSVGADGEEPGVPDRDLTRVPHQDVQPDGDDRVDRQQAHQVDHVAAQELRRDQASGQQQAEPEPARSNQVEQRRAGGVRTVQHPGLATHVRLDLLWLRGSQ